MDYLGILLGASIINNYVLGKMIGITPFLSSPKKITSSFFMGLAITIALLISSIITYPLYVLIVKPLELYFLDIFIYGFFLLIVIRILFKILEQALPKVYNTIGVYLPMIMFNSVLFGVPFGVGEQYYNFTGFFLYSLGSGIGYTLALVFMSILYQRLPHSRIPEYIKGSPLILFCAGIISMIFQMITGAIDLF